MAEPMPQTFQNHIRRHPLHQFVMGPIFLLNLVFSGYRLVTEFSVDTVMGLVVAVGLVLLFVFSRVFALGAQDRVIRLEERMRLQALSPDNPRLRINDLTTSQLIALRFASDAELPALAQKVLDDGVADQKSIKRLIKTWRPDHQRV
jgi:uncharacterized membrane protein YciS (DUF1049 family)